MLIAYQQRTRLLLSDPTFARFNDFDLRDFLNTARGQIAGEAKCVRVYGTLTLAVGQRSYPFSAIVTNSVPGIAAVNTVQTMWFEVASGQMWFPSREWEWFGLYHLNNPVPDSGQPQVWAQLGQGQAGTIFVDPLPDFAYVCPVDVAAAPILLTADIDIEAVPPLWQDAVPYFAAYVAALTAGNKDYADTMMGLYKTFMDRARVAAISDVLPGSRAQGPDLLMANRLGLAPARRGAAGADA